MSDIDEIADILDAHPFTGDHTGWTTREQADKITEWLKAHDAEVRKRALTGAADLLEHVDRPEEAFKVREMITDV